MGGIKGIVYVCPHCGNAWARADLYPSGTYMVAANSPCWDHGDKYSLGGNVLPPLLWWDPCLSRSAPTFYQNLSPELLRYSAEVRINHILKGFR